MTTRRIRKDFEAGKSMREIRNNISLEIADMNYEQLKAYFKQHRLQKKQSNEPGT